MNKRFGIPLFLVLMMWGCSVFGFQQTLGLTTWDVVGPFTETTVENNWRTGWEKDWVNESNPDLSFSSLTEKPPLQVLAGDSGAVVISETLGGTSVMGVFYARAEIEVQDGGAALLATGGSGPERVFVNGEVVWDKIFKKRTFEANQVKIPVTLKSGKNVILVKIVRFENLPFTFNVSLLPGQTMGDKVTAWLPFLFIILVWGGLGWWLQHRPHIAAYPEGRLVSLDALRGFDMFFITGGGAVLTELAWKMNNMTLYHNFEHKTWNGFFYWDLIFPMFLFIVGVAVPLATERRRAKGVSDGEIAKHIILRGIGLVLLGIFLNGGMKFTHLSDLRLAGVLQRIGICYVVAALLSLKLNWKALTGLGVAILAGYWAMVALIPVPGVGANVILPDKCLPNYLDRLYLPGKQVWGTWDNEGLLSTLPAVVTCLLGVLAGRWLTSDVDKTRKAGGLALAGVISAAVGWMWHPVFPVNKLIWSSSYVLVAGGYSMLFLAVFFWVVDVRGYRRWAFPFIVVGSNAIFAYAFPWVFTYSEIANRLGGGVIAEWFGPWSKLYLFTLSYLISWSVLYWLWKRKIFFKL